MQTTDPDWEQPPVRPIVDARVAVHGFCEAQLCRRVADMMIGGKLWLVFRYLLQSVTSSAEFNLLHAGKMLRI